MRTPAFLVRLMAYSRLSSTLRRGPEDNEALAFASDLRELTLKGRLLAVWTHPANELAGATFKNGKVRVSPLVALARALGLITGTPDYLFLYRDGAIAIEMKSSSGSLSERQRDFRDWCELVGVPFHVCRSRTAAIEVLEQTGLITEHNWMDVALTAKEIL